jgi:alpha-ribazole phosphatase CobZ
MKIEREKGYIAVHANPNGNFNVLSSAVYNGGSVRTCSTIINLNVSDDFHGDAFAVFDSFIEEKKLEREKVVGIMTAVPMEKAVIKKKGAITAIITAGISASTINIILVIEKNLSQAAMANTLIVATEAKTAALFDLDMRDEQGDLFTGDSTDSVVVAGYGKTHLEKGEEEEIFAGKATKLGSAVYEVVRKGVKEALFRYNGLTVDRPILKRLEERGIYLEDMVSTALELYVPPVEGEAGAGEQELEKRLEATIKKECSDVNVALLLAAALHSDEEEIRKGRAGKAGEEDAACIVADELIGIDIAEYIGGKKALFNFFYYDTRKPGILSQLDVFMDDAIGGLIAGCMSKMLG